jgi:arginase
LSVGLLANCTSLLGVLGGLQHSGASRRPLRVGLVFVDAHGDFNTPETTLSGMLGGMPVAVAAGLALTNLRLKSGLDLALPTRYIVMAALRDTDPLEQELIDRSDIQLISVQDIRTRSENMHAQMRRLSKLTDVIYVHIDMDVLDPSEVAGHSLTVPNGPTSIELAAALTDMFRYQKVAALGIASTPAGDNDPGGLSLRAAYRLVVGAALGAQQRGETER